MRRIFISEQLYQFAKEYGKDPFTTRTGGFIKPKVKLAELRDALPEASKLEKNYIQKIIDEYEILNCLKPKEIAQKKVEFDAILHEDNLGAKYSINGEKKGLHEWIVDAMRYDALRKTDFIKDKHPILDIKACVYCNAQLTVVVKDSDNGIHAKFQLDHFYPKSKYPFVSISFFNLYPVCANCNIAKQNDSILFQLYTENSNESLNPFLFYLRPGSIARYVNSQTESDIEIGFMSINDKLKLSHDHNQRFCIEGIYATQKDIAAELIQKKIIYTDSYKQHLASQFRSLFPNQLAINRLLIGNYDLEKDIHKRPLAKFTQDIARQLKLIK